MGIQTKLNIHTVRIHTYRWCCGIIYIQFGVNAGRMVDFNVLFVLLLFEFLRYTPHDWTEVASPWHAYACRAWFFVTLAYCFLVFIHMGFCLNRAHSCISYKTESQPNNMLIFCYSSHFRNINTFPTCSIRNPFFIVKNNSCYSCLHSRDAATSLSPRRQILLTSLDFGTISLDFIHPIKSLGGLTKSDVVK